MWIFAASLILQQECGRVLVTVLVADNDNLYAIVKFSSILAVSYSLLVVSYRSVGKTLVNEQSSRSHFVFTLRISGVNEVLELLVIETLTIFNIIYLFIL